ncbi:hypothetical protein AAY473_040397 [Plecturocebus cupreus]
MRMRKRPRHKARRPPGARVTVTGPVAWETAVPAAWPSRDPPEPEEENRASYLREKNMRLEQPLYGRKVFLEREDKDGLCCKRSPRLKTGELREKLARELETTNKHPVR